MSNLNAMDAWQLSLKPTLRPSVGWSASSTTTTTTTTTTANNSPSSPREPKLNRAQVQMRCNDKERKHQQLKACIQRLRAAMVPGSDPGSVDGAFDEFASVREMALEIVQALLTPRGPAGSGHSHGPFQSRGMRRRNGSVQETVERLEMLRIADGNKSSDNDVDGLMAAFANMEIAGSTAAGRAPSKNERGGQVNPVWLAAIRDWKAVIQKLLESHRTSLAGMYRAYEKDATPEMVERMLDNSKYRVEAIHKMRARRPSVVSDEFAKAAFYWPTHERRFRNYDTLREAVMEADRFLRLGEAGGDEGDRLVKDYVISAGGDAVLEFANLGSFDSPVLQFQVSSHMLAETSPIFRAVFQGQFSHPRVLDRDLRELDGQVPREPPRFVTCPDGAEVKLYSMPQLELNKEDSLAVLLYAAHMQNDKIPREVSFAQFTAIADVCLRYQCTSPLEVVVEHRWLPAWMHMATEDQPDGLLLISYTFGLRRIFTRMSKTAVLHIVDDEELRGKNWPERIKEKVWAVRSAKMAQVYAACTGAIQEYFRPPTGHSSDEKPTSRRAGETLPPPPFPKPSSFLPTLQFEQPPPPSYLSLFSLTSTPRCPKGSHWCDATNLGWLLLVLNELQLLWTVITPSALPGGQGAGSRPPSPRSLAQLLNALRSIPSPPQPVHPGGSGVCDPAPAFRAAVNDVYNSTSGLTLLDVDGKRHGWALSKQHANDPQSVLKLPLGTFASMSLEDGKVAPVPVDDHVDACPEAIVESSQGYSGDASFTEDEGLDDADADADEADDGHWVNRPPVTFIPDSSDCLRIMSAVDSFEDLHALAVTNRTFYTTFRQNELTLMRRLVKANRRLTLNVLLAEGGGPLPSKTGRRDGDKVLLQVKEAMTTPTTASLGASQGIVEENHYSVVDGTTRYHQHPGGDVDSKSEGKRHGSNHEDLVDGNSMTEEEAHRILWPDQAPGPPCDKTVADVAPPPLSPQMPRENSAEKFLAGEMSSVQAAEEKALVVLGDKNLREELDWRKGITSE
ncbi:hypothetical protein VM1G_10767 [Cytospora mali]|uniref:BTB domain-containing protein n=1 Tax=Cytospora mali TaxID=578113 RepID=A0A194VJB6_CYTMA|nr:hypothetical protein VM1G_10767 [Valsa mali]